MAQAADNEVCKEILAPLPETKRGYGIHMYASKQDMFTYCNGRTVVVRSLADPSKSTLFSEHKAQVNVAAFSPNGEWIASGDDEGKVIVWAVNGHRIKNETFACGRVLDISWSPDGKRICAVGGGQQDRAKVFSWDSGNNLGKILGHSKDILSCHYRPCRPFRIATGSEDLSVKFFNGPPFKFDHSYDGHARYPNRVRYSPDGSILITVGADSKIVVFDGKTGEPTGELKCDNGHKGAIYGFDFSPDGKQILTVSSDKTAKIWDVAESKVVQTFNFAEKPQISDMQMGAMWHKDYLLTVSLSGAINYLDVANPNQPKLILQGSKSAITSLSLDTKNGKFYSADVDGYLSQHDYGTKAATWFAGKGHGKTIAACEVTCDGTKVVTVGLDDTIRYNAVDGLAFADGEKLGGLPLYLAVGNKDAGLACVVLAQDKLVVARDGKIVSSTDLDFTPTCCALNMDDTRVAVGSKKNNVHVYSLEKDTPTLVATLKKHTRAVGHVKYSKDGRVLTTVGKDRHIFNWPADCGDDGKVLNSSGWPFHSQTVNSVDWSPAGDRAVSGAQDENIIVWHDVAGEKFGNKRDTHKLAHKAGVLQARWWDDKNVVSVGGNRTIKYFSL